MLDLTSSPTPAWKRSPASLLFSREASIGIWQAGGGGEPTADIDDHQVRGAFRTDHYPSSAKMGGFGYSDAGRGAGKEVLAALTQERARLYLALS